jgi:hypothetical protein
MNNPDFPPSFCADASIIGSDMNTAACHATGDGCTDREPSMQRASAAAAAGTAFCSKAHVPCSHLQLTSNPLTPRQFFPTLRVCAKSPQSPTRRPTSRARAPHLQPLPFTATSAPPISDNIIIRTSVSRHPNAKCTVSSAGAACNALNADASATSRPGVQSKTSQTCSWKRQTSHLRPNNLTLTICTPLSPPGPPRRPSPRAPSTLYSHSLPVFPQHLVCSSVFMSRDRHTQAADKAFVTFTSQRELLAALTMDRPRWNEKCHDDDECRDSPITVSSAALLAATTLTQARRAAVLCNPRNLFS